MMYLPRLRTPPEPQLSPLARGAIYKREEDGIVLIDRDKCRGWRLCISGRPYKKSTLTGRAASLRSAYFAIRVLNPASRPFVRKPASGASVILAFCSTTPTGFEEAASTEHGIAICMNNVSAMFLNPHDPAVILKRQALKQGIPQTSSTPPNGRRCTKWRWTEAGGPAAPGIPHPADGSGRTAAVAHPVIRRRGPQYAIFCRRWSIAGIPEPVPANMLSARAIPSGYWALKVMMAMCHHMRRRRLKALTIPAPLTKWV